jgi:hypothetical protein
MLRGKVERVRSPSSTLETSCAGRETAGGKRRELRRLREACDDRRESASLAIYGAMKVTVVPLYG